MSKNRFEQVDEPQEDAITLSLSKQDDGACGTVTVPAALSGGKLVNDVVSDKLPAVDAFRSAIRLANEMKVPIVVMDPEATWLPEWGALYRAD